LRCELCNINYKSRTGLWKHNKNYHTKILVETEIIPQNSTNNTQKPTNLHKIILCKDCNKLFSRNDSLKRHELKCVMKEKKNDKIILLEEKIKILEKKCIGKKINNNSNNYNNNRIINNNIFINKIGNENINKLNKNEIMQIFNKEFESVLTFVELLNFNDRLKENHSFCTTNLESIYLSIYNNDTKTIDKERKKYFFDTLLEKID
jgi:hypothetical protein